MSKKYVSPESLAIDILSQAILAGSDGTDVPIGGGGSQDGTNVLSNRRSIWDAMNNEDK